MDSIRDEQDNNSISSNPPDGYVEPGWPALYSALHQDPQYLYQPYAIWRFTLYWTLLFYGFIFLVTGLLLLVNFSKRHPRLTLLSFALWILTSLFLGLVSSTIVAYALAALYNAAFLRMSTWVPPLWGLVQAMLLIFSAAANVPFFTG
ncbi:BQ2448_937 [Microbotryum intermedium]|uniref:BQ2448_937 protein n=1 Tax=Microbotryum intermedium TaxID=269621 RepID=A0A238FCK2_9BASI|nr:BQ2448_937 [Microbotryum intermedium]